jgi:hypothetical protein
MKCDCVDKCARWGVYADKPGGFFCPYNPFEENPTECQRLTNKDIGPTIIEEEEEE